MRWWGWLGLKTKRCGGGDGSKTRGDGLVAMEVKGEDMRWW